jgi:hypothetical protein
MGAGVEGSFLAVCMEGSSQEYSTVIGDVNSKLNWYPPGPEIAFVLRWIDISRRDRQEATKNGPSSGAQSAR